ncbi:MFS transporter [Demequina sp. SO4-13]|uniref:MFS transporter n=1 Tax=Demequina sp. SO4-13 TaxID=3401027 RepID=UPI003AF7AC7E
MSFARDLSRLWRSDGFRRLTYVRLLSQGGDGMFQVGIAAAFFFDPTQAATPGAIAAGFAVLLAPFTLVGPFVGPLIDRWQRQRILMVGNIVRLGLVAAICALLVADLPVWTLYVAALLTLSVNRFLLASITAGLPRVVDREDLLAANAIQPTLGTIAAAVGGAVGGIVTFIAPQATDTSLALWALAAGGAAFGLAAWATLLLGRRSLGPVIPLEHLNLAAQVRGLGAELGTAVRYLRARVTPFHALLVMAAQRLLYGVMFVASILISRHVLGDPDRPEQALGNFTLVVAFAAVGFGLAAVLTPVFGSRFTRHQWIVLCLVVGAVGQTALAISTQPWALFSAAVVVSFAVQGGKIAVDTIVQRDTEDSVRGRAFTLYDMAFNVAFISSAVIGGLVLPDDGYSRVVMSVLVALYVVTALVFVRAPREPSPAPVPTS